MHAVQDHYADPIFDSLFGRKVRIDNRNNSNNQEDYQICLEIKKTHLRFEGLECPQFIDENLAPIDYWSESFPGKIWLEVKKISASSMCELRMVEREEASDIDGSNGDGTFDFFEDFNDRFDDGYCTDIIQTSLNAHREPTALGEVDQIDLWFWGGSGQRIHYASSTDGLHYSAPTELTDIAVGWGRAHILKESGTYYLYVVDVDASSQNLRLYTGTNKTNFTSQGTVFTRDTGIGWENSMLGNVFVWKEKTNDWYMLYEAKGTEWKIGLATSTDGKNWTRYGSNPVIDGTNSGNPEMARLGSEILKYNSKYYVFTHEQIGTTWEIHRWYSTDLHSWTDEGEIAGIVKTPSTYSHGGHALVQFKDKIYMLWTPSNQVDTSYINIVMENLSYNEILALAPKSINDKWIGDTSYASVSDGEMTYLGPGSWKRIYSRDNGSEKTFGPTMALRCKGKQVAQLCAFGFSPNPCCDHRVIVYNTGFISHDGASQEITTTRWSYNTEYIFDIKQIGGTSDKFYIDDILDTTHSTHPGNSAVPVTVASEDATVILDWMLVRKYSSPEPTAEIGVMI